MWECFEWISVEGPATTDFHKFAINFRFSKLSSTHSTAGPEFQLVNPHFPVSFMGVGGIKRKELLTLVIHRLDRIMLL